MIGDPVCPRIKLARGLDATRVGETVAWQLVMAGTIERRAWGAVARAIASAIRQDRALAPPDEEATLP